MDIIDWFLDRTLSAHSPCQSELPMLLLWTVPCREIWSTQQEPRNRNHLRMDLLQSCIRKRGVFAGLHDNQDLQDSRDHNHLHQSLCLDIMFLAGNSYHHQQIHYAAMGLCIFQWTQTSRVVDCLNILWFNKCIVISVTKLHIQKCPGNKYEKAVPNIASIGRWYTCSSQHFVSQIFTNIRRISC